MSAFGGGDGRSDGHMTAGEDGRDECAVVTDPSGG